MCGIAGLWRFAGAPEPALAVEARAMTSAIAYRGPDDDGHWFDADAGVALGHRRLAIVDLSPTGRQPMSSANGRVVLTYNGELYNRAELTAELARRFRGTSDTEVLVEAIAEFGIDGALARANGIFAFAAYDRTRRTLHVARDRLGVKPIYWTRQNGCFAFASELKALRRVPGLVFDIDPGAVASFLRHAYVPAPASIFTGVEKLLPGHRLEVTPHGIIRHCYWDLVNIARAGQASPDRRAEADIVAEIHALLADAVARQMVSDVPLGAFLSSGIDSSTVVALMQRASNRPVKTFSIGFREAAFNEAAAARAVARHLGTDHTEIELSAADALALVPQLSDTYDEPFADASQLPTMLVSAVARRDVTVALSGDGGDEVFAGYVRYQSVPRLAEVSRRVPRPLRRAAASLIQMLSRESWDRIAGVFPDRQRPSHPGQKILKGAAVLGDDDALAMYRRLVSQIADPAAFLVGAKQPQDIVELHAGDVAGLDTVSQLRLLDQLTYLPDDILTKVDRASMAVSLEVRVPLLDHRVVEAAWRLPTSRLIADGEGKRPLRAVLDAYVPRALVHRPKTGFGVPVSDWLRGPLRDWAGDILSPSSMSGSLLDVAAVARLVSEVQSGREAAYGLWAVLQFEAWRHCWR